MELYTIVLRGGKDGFRQASPEHEDSSDTGLHDGIVLAQVRAYQEEGGEVLAVNLEGWTRPARVGAHVPDIVARHQGKMTYNEVETCKTVSSPETRRRCEEIARAGILHLTVPRMCLQSSERLVARRGIPVGTEWSYDGA